jgi:hypothetical protein
MRAITIPDPEPSIDVRLRDVLIRLSLLSHGSTQNFSATAGRGGGEQILPAGEGHPPQDRFITMLQSPEPDLATILAEAEATLDGWRRRPLAPAASVESLDDLKARIVSVGVGWPTRDVSLSMRCTESLVRVARVEASRDPTTGEQLDEPLPSDPRQLAAALLELGMSYRQAEAICGVPIATLSRQQRRAA